MGGGMVRLITQRHILTTTNIESTVGYVAAQCEDSRWCLIFGSNLRLMLGLSTLILTCFSHVCMI